MRKLLIQTEKSAENKGKLGEEDTEMVDELANKNGSQNFAEEIARNLSEIMTKFVSAYKQILEKKVGKYNLRALIAPPPDLTSKVV